MSRKKNRNKNRKTMSVPEAGYIYYAETWRGGADPSPSAETGPLALRACPR